MENPLISFQYDTDPVRVVMVDGQPWWVASDLAKLLGYRHAPSMVRMVPEEWAGVHLVHSSSRNDGAAVHLTDTSSQRREMTIISEGGMWMCIGRSRRPEAIEIQKWMFGEVMPAIRKTGRYEIPGYELERELREPGADIDPRDLGAKVGAVRLCWRLFGHDAARNLWIDLGIPLRLADARALYRDAIAGPLSAWLAEHEPSTTAEITGGVGLDPTNAADRRRVTTVLHMLGWWSKRTRRGADLAWCWYAPETAAAEG